MKRIHIIGILSLFILGVTIIACYKPAPNPEPWQLSFQTPIVVSTNSVLQVTPFLPATRPPGQPIVSPTPDTAHIMPTLRSEPVSYTVQFNDSLSAIARKYGVDLNAVMNANQINNANYLEVGQVLTIPTVDPNLEPADFKIIPDSELVFGPTSIGFDINSFLNKYGGYLSTMENSGSVVMQVAKDYSVNPRILLSLLEYQTGWVTSANKDLDNSKPAPTDAWKTSLFTVLSRTANSLNMGYYDWRANQLSYYVLSDGSYIPTSATINAGTAAVQYWASDRYGKTQWQKTVSEDGVFTTYKNFFGYPFDYSFDPLIPENLSQPDMILPFQQGVAWSFTGGPHPAWGDGAAWSALDFAPPGSPMGCAVSGDWVTAVADGLIVRTEFGAVIQDLDGDGYEQSGWVVLYMHMSTWERVEPGTFVEKGALIGHASCEGGISSGSHLHIARRYNGEWIDADGDIPFIMDGYQAESSGIAYNGFLERNGAYIEAWDRYRPESLVAR